MAEAVAEAVAGGAKSSLDKIKAPTAVACIYFYLFFPAIKQIQANNIIYKPYMYIHAHILSSPQLALAGKVRCFIPGEGASPRHEGVFPGDECFCKVHSQGQMYVESNMGMDTL